MQHTRVLLLLSPGLRDQLKVHLSPEQLRAVMQRFDRNDDGMLHYAEFVRMMQSGKGWTAAARR